MRDAIEARLSELGVGVAADYDDVLERIGSAGIVVCKWFTEHSPLRGSDIVITPHMGGATPHYWGFAENYEHFVDGDFDALVNRIR